MSVKQLFSRFKESSVPDQQRQSDSTAAPPEKEKKEDEKGNFG